MSTSIARPWDGVVPVETQERYRRAGFGRSSGIGQRPALLVIDVQYHAVGRKAGSSAEGLPEHAMSCGDAAWEAVPHIARLQAAFRERGLSVIFPCVAPRGVHERGRFDRMPDFTGTDARDYDILDEIAPRSDEILLPNYKPSAFFGTTLVSRLMGLGVDTVFVTGCTTSGCIRATSVDAFAYGYKVLVPHEACFDRSSISHAVNLFDLYSKYADVVTTASAVDMVARLGLAR
jgi:nicotinamidase-related amidase